MRNTVAEITPMTMTSPAPRIGVFSLRRTAQEIFRCSGYEYEDAILSEFHTGHLIEPVAHGHPGARLQRFLGRHGLPGQGMRFGADSAEMADDLDLLFAYPAFVHELLELNSVRDWRARSRFAICHLQEAWASEAETRIAEALPILRQFDHIYCAMYHTVEVLQKMLDVPVSYLPWGLNAESMCPWPANHARVLDVAAIGKVDGATHDSLWDWAGRTGRYYNYTSTGLAKYSVSHTHHRANFVQTLQRAQYFFVFLAKREHTIQRHTQREFGLRYFEGAAAGAIQLGDLLPDNPGFVEHLDWEGAVIEAPYGSDNVPDLIESLEKDPDWVEDTRRRGVTHCLRRHDYVYRWAEILRCAGLAETPAMSARRDRLEKRAQTVESCDYAALDVRAQA